MKKLILALIVVAIAWKGYGAYQRASLAASPAVPASAEWVSDEPADGVRDTEFACDGRTHCSQMTSCEEATYFINHCPGTKMDGNNDGVPCESQWCR